MRGMRTRTTFEQVKVLQRVFIHNYFLSPAQEHTRTLPYPWPHYRRGFMYPTSSALARPAYVYIRRKLLVSIPITHLLTTIGHCFNCDIPIPQESRPPTISGISQPTLDPKTTSPDTECIFKYLSQLSCFFGFEQWTRIAVFGTPNGCARISELSDAA